MSLWTTTSSQGSISQCRLLWCKRAVWSTSGSRMKYWISKSLSWMRVRLSFHSKSWSQMTLLLNSRLRSTKLWTNPREQDRNFGLTKPLTAFQTSLKPRSHISSGWNGSLWTELSIWPLTQNLWLLTKASEGPLCYRISSLNCPSQFPLLLLQSFCPLS